MVHKNINTIKSSNMRAKTKSKIAKVWLKFSQTVSEVLN